MPSFILTRKIIPERYLGLGQFYHYFFTYTADDYANKGRYRAFRALPPQPLDAIYLIYHRYKSLYLVRLLYLPRPGVAYFNGLYRWLILMKTQNA